LDVEVAERYGHMPVNIVALERRLKAATKAKDWALASQLTAELAAQQPGKVG
jgi:hypothetical protein